MHLSPLPKPDQLNFTPDSKDICVITDDGTETVLKLAGMIQEAGWKSIVILRLFSKTSAPTQSPPNQFPLIELPDYTDSAIEQTLKTIEKSHGLIRFFIHLHPVWSEESGSNDLFFDADKQILKQIFLTAKFLKKPLTKAAESGRSGFITVTRLNGQLGFGGAAPSAPVAGGYFGLIKTANIEWPDVFCRAIDLDPNLKDREAAGKILSEALDADYRITEVGHTSDKRVTLTAEPETEHSTSNEKAAVIDENSVFLVSGGGKGITADCIIELARQNPCAFILLGRTQLLEEEPDWARDCFDDAELKSRCMKDFQQKGEKPTPVKIMGRLKPILSSREIRSTIDSLEKCGSRVHYISADLVSDKNLKQKVAEIENKSGAVTGIIHGAGVLADKLIEDKTANDFESVYSTKVEGLKALLECASQQSLKHLVLFSSSAGFYGNEGQSDYAMANEILNKLAFGIKNAYPLCRVIALNWGPWDSGMVTPELKRLFEQRDIAVIPRNIGSKIMVDELINRKETPAQIVVGSSMVVPRPFGKELKSYRISSSLALDDNPFLKDHSIGGEPVLPVICVVAWMAKTCEGLYPGFRFFSCENTKVFKGLVFKDAQPKTYTMEVTEINKTETGKVALEVKISGLNENNKTVFHYSSNVVLLRSIPAPPAFKEFDHATRNPIAGEEFYKDGTLFHGPSFQVIQQLVNADSNKMTLECRVKRLNAQTQGQFPVASFNHFADDAMLQAMLIWARQQYQSGSLPLSINLGEFYTPIAFDQRFYITLEIKTSSKSKLTADLTAYSENGQIFSRLSDAEVTISKSLNEKFKKTTTGKNK